MTEKTLLSLGVVLLFFSVFTLGALDLQYTTEIQMQPANPLMGHSVIFYVYFKPAGDSVSNLKITGGVGERQLVEQVLSNIPPNSVRKIKFTWIATSTDNNCHSTAWFVLDPDHTTNDSNYSNNRIEKIVCIAFEPWNDFRFTTPLLQDPRNITVGNNVTFSAVLKNDGAQGAVKLRVTGGIDNITFFDQTFTYLNAQETRSVAFNWTATGGTKTAWFQIDPDQVQGEDAPLSNNRVEKVLKVLGGKPDLTLEVQMEQPAYNENQIDFHIVSQNTGDAKSAPFIIQVKMNNNVVELHDCPGLEHGQICSFTYHYPKKCGDSISIKVDSTNTNNESNEINNAWTKSLFCIGK